MAFEAATALLPSECRAAAERVGGSAAFGARAITLSSIQSNQVLVLLAGRKVPGG
jgi:hypothetical protein